MPLFIMSLAQNVKRYRRNAGICQEYVAAQLCVDQSTYSRVEKNDKACARRLDSLARVLDTTPDVLRTYHLIAPSDEADELAAARKLIAEQQREIDDYKATIRQWEQIWQKFYGGATDF